MRLSRPPARDARDQRGPRSSGCRLDRKATKRRPEIRGKILLHDRRRVRGAALSTQWQWLSTPEVAPAWLAEIHVLLPIVLRGRRGARHPTVLPPVVVVTRRLRVARRPRRWGIWLLRLRRRCFATPSSRGGGSIRRLGPRWIPSKAFPLWTVGRSSTRSRPWSAGGGGFRLSKWFRSRSSSFWPGFLNPPRSRGPVADGPRRPTAIPGGFNRAAALPVGPSARRP